jgi:glycosyltransferase involved in cell wall biosynthesis
MKVVILLPGLTRSVVGGYKVIYQYANYLAAKGHDVTLSHSRLVQGGLTQPLTLRTLGSAIRRDGIPGARPDWYPLHSKVQVRNRPFLNRRAVPAADVFVATAVQTAPLAAWAAIEHDAAGVYFIQHFEQWAASRDFVESSWRLPLHRVVIAPWLADVGRELGVETALVPNAIDPEEFPPGPPVSERPTDVLAMVSGVTWKRTDLVVEVLLELKRRHPSLTAATFGTCSRPGRLPSYVDHYQDPPRTQLAALYRSAKVYLCASDMEGWHLPPAEAMSSRAAVVSTAIPGVEAYADGIALFSSPGQAAGLIENCELLLSEEATCQSRADRGHQRIASYLPEHAAHAFERELSTASVRRHAR